ncbi:MAG: transketolase [Myxococcota bacterium]|nr:transketolase [Myxococcota bacterium]
MTISSSLRTDITTTIRMLAVDAIEKAKSGHPGAPMGLADIAFLVWDEYLKFDPSAPNWYGRDRFVLSCGHASMLQYALLHLWGYDVSMDDIKAFRQWDSITPGHPEVGMTPGVEVTTGPLGQGVANSVGMALAGKMLSARIAVESEPFNPMGQRVFALCSDGDLMEGVAYEAASMAGHWQLDNLVWLYDDNKITIDGSVELAFSEDVAKRFESMGWFVQSVDGHDADAIREKLDSAVAKTGAPSLIICRTHIGLGSPNKVDSSKSHGSPLGADEVALTRQGFNWPETEFHIPASVRAYFQEASNRKKSQHVQWQADFARWRESNPTQAKIYDDHWLGDLATDFWTDLVEAAPAAGATRKTSQAVLNKAVAMSPTLVGGSADLTGSNGSSIPDTAIVGSPTFSGQDFSFAGRMMHYGIREHAMGSVANGMLLHGGFRPFTATFLIFSDYMRPSIRLAALSHLPNIFIFTHDSVFLGEDGPTHQPIEHHWALRMIPNLAYFRPADGVEVAMAWAWTMKSSKTPAALGLTRQGLPAIERAADFDPKQVWRGGYVISEIAQADVTLVGTGSELHLCVDAAAILASEGIRARVVSMPCVDLFEEQSTDYIEMVLPGDIPVVTVEAGVTGPWRAYTGRTGLAIGIDRFGASAPAEILAEKFGLTAPQVAHSVKSSIKGSR